MALIVTFVGITCSNHIAAEQPFAALILSLITVITPVFVATRIAWSSGYVAGRSDANRASRGQHTDTKNSDIGPVKDQTALTGSKDTTE